MKFFHKARLLITETMYGFMRDECYSMASSLSFYSLLAIVPILAVAFGIAKGFGFEATLEDEILHGLYQQETVAKTLINFAHSLLEETKGGVIAGVGFVLLFWTVMGLLGALEHSLNIIWKAPSSRSYTRKFSDYLAIMIFCPIFFVASSSLNFYVFSSLIEFAHTTPYYQTTKPFLIAVFQFTPFVLSWILFSFIYIFIPNVKISWKSGIFAGILAGTSFLIIQWVYIHFQIGVAKYNAVYGSFAAIPLFLAWLQISWLILFAGAEFAFQLEKHRFSPHLKTREKAKEEASRKEIGLILLSLAIDAFKSGKKAESLYEISERLTIPLPILQDLAEGFKEANLLLPVENAEETEMYIPAKEISLINVKTFFDGLDASQYEIVIVSPSEELDKARKMLEKINKELEKMAFWS